MCHKLLVLLVYLALTLAQPLFADSVLEPATDTINSGIIKTKMLTDHSLKNADVSVSVDNGIAYFSGRVTSQSQIDELSSIALSVSGIKGVDISKVKVKPME